MLIEEGKRYICGDGYVTDKVHPFGFNQQCWADGERAWTKSGRYHDSDHAENATYAIVAPWTDDQPAPEAVKPQDIRVGGTAHIRTKVLAVHGDGSVTIRAKGGYWPVPRSDIVHVEPRPAPPKSGDSVRHRDHSSPGIVLFIDDDQAWVKFQEDGRHVVLLAELERADD